MRKIIVISVVVFMVGFIIYSFFRDRKEDKLLEIYQTTTAIITKMSPSAYRSSASGHFKYSVNGREYAFSESGNYYKYMSIGDTVLIEYSKKDHSVARVLDKYYMQKYKHLENR